MADIRDQSLRLVVKPFRISEKQEHYHHRCPNQVVVKIVFENTEPNQDPCDEVHSSFFPLLNCGFPKRLLGRRPRVEALVPFKREGEPPDEKEIIDAARAESRGRISASSGAAAKLGIPPSTLDLTAELNS
jgi:hypothetical protein